MNISISTEGVVSVRTVADFRHYHGTCENKINTKIRANTNKLHIENKKNI